ncbi:uncharacterized protein LOC143535408 [Bidens hawaiensis]|uniref:uncharacterized protein LOC143535408 n=1 Tax=Bidens hawaiensis TaxID=980011 RepID=UPI0040491C11
MATDINIDKTYCKQQRKRRRLILDYKRKRGKFVTESSSHAALHRTQQTRYDTSHQYSLISSNSNRHASFDKENINSHEFLTHPQKNSISSSPIINITSPLSNITNVIYNTSNTPTTATQIMSTFSLLSNVGTSSNTSTLTRKGSFTKIPSGKRKLTRNTICTSDIPSFDLTEEGFVDQEFGKDIFKGISKDYSDHGDQSVICEMCHAKLWKDEAKRGQRTNGEKISYFMCCCYGKVQLPKLKELPADYISLFTSSDAKSKFFLKNIRRYNSMFSFTSMGGKIDKSINKGNAPFIFRLSGQNYHNIGSLLPTTGSKPKFAQLYIYDTDNEVSNRQTIFDQSDNGNSSTSNVIDLQIIQQLKHMLDSHNQLVKCYRMARDCFSENPAVDLKLRLIGRRQNDARTYNLPTASEVAALIVGDIGDCIDNRDIIFKTQEGGLQTVNEHHPSYLALQYPLIYPYGEDNYTVDILHRGVAQDSEAKRKKTTMREFFAYRIQDRVNEFSMTLNSRSLFQQQLVDGYMMIESERLYYIRREQKALRCETFENLSNIKSKGNKDASKVGQSVILPSSFTGGARYMMQNYLDAMSLFKRFLKDTTLKAEDRPDILCRLFKIKLDALIKDLKEKALLGKVQAVVYSVEFQKRGLPHAHICLFMHPNNKFPTVEHIDLLISAEIPDKNQDPELYSLVSDFMIHGPCGADNMKCSCMVNKKCSKKFPKKFRDETCVDTKGFPIYRRRDSGNFVVKSDVHLDNRSVVPYNHKLLRKYQGHINVEWCNQSGSIKYLFKYINKGPDQTTVSVVQNSKEDDSDEGVDEIKEYYDCRYLSACEAAWRIFSFDIHYRYPSVMRLPFHLPDKQQVFYGPDDDVKDILDKRLVASTMFTSWMECN